MARKNKKAQAQAAPVQQVSQRTQMPPMGAMPGGYPYPVAPASQFVQLPPIVQPIVMVPFASQQQPLATFDEDDDDFDF
ncbi:MAG: hypothetical protein IJ735_04805 [Clostridia bacterium]|nr:hypothetical protein [Clostridia bacterium]